MSAILFSIQPGGEAIFLQLVAQVRALRAGGRLRPGELLPSVRRVAEDLTINPMTVSRAWSQLEQEGVVETVRGLGMRVLALPDGGMRHRLAELHPALSQVVRQAQRLDLSAAVVISQLREQFAKDQS